VEIILAAGAALLFGTALFMLQRGDLIGLLVGLLLISQSANMCIFLAGGIQFGSVGIIAEGEKALSPAASDPLPQALILTAIVIGLATFSFAFALAIRSWELTNQDKITRNSTEK